MAITRTFCQLIKTAAYCEACNTRLTLADLKQGKCPKCAALLGAITDAEINKLSGLDVAPLPVSYQQKTLLPPNSGESETWHLGTEFEPNTPSTVEPTLEPEPEPVVSQSVELEPTLEPAVVAGGATTAPVVTAPRRPVRASAMAARKTLHVSAVQPEPAPKTKRRAKRKRAKKERAIPVMTAHEQRQYRKKLRELDEFLIGYSERMAEHALTELNPIAEAVLTEIHHHD